MPETIKASASQSGLAQPGKAQSARARASKALSADGNPHPVQLGLTAFTVLAGIIAFGIGFVVRLHTVATVLGLAALVVGLYTQMISVSRVERIFLMAGVVPAFVGVCLGLAHGGFG